MHLGESWHKEQDPHGHKRKVASRGAWPDRPGGGAGDAPLAPEGEALDEVM